MRQPASWFAAVLLTLGLVEVPAEAATSRAVLGPEYPQVARETIQQAAASIDLAMYFIILDPRRADDPVTPLVEALIEAHRRGVRVTIVVENGKPSENAAALARLRQGGVAVVADSPSTLLHAKALVVDERWVLVGSTNWSRAAFLQNAEAAVLVDDPETARLLAAAIRRWAVQGALSETSRVSPGAPDAETVAIPTAWIRANGPLSRLVETRADVAFHVALALARDGARPDPRNPVAWTPYWRELGITRPRTRYNVRRQLAALDLAGPMTGADIAVPPPGPSLTPPWASTIVVPVTFWTFQYARILSTRAQLLYVVALAEAARSTRAPCWFRSQQHLAAATGLSDVTVGLALLELERGHLLTVRRDPARPPVFAARRANDYCVVPLAKRGEHQG